MKVALVLSGHFRTFASNLVYFKECIMNKNDTDVYFDLWDTYGFWYPDMVDGFNLNSEKIDPEKIKELLGESLKYLNIDIWDEHRDYFLERSKAFEQTKVVYDRSKPDGASRPGNLISLWYKRYKGIAAMNASGIQYDKVVLTRPDVRLKNTIDMHNGNLELVNSYADHSRGYADIFFNGSQQQITDLAEVYNHMEETLNVNMEFCGHSLMKWWLPKKQIPFEIKSYELELINTPGGYCKL
jgi:hypothetical protein